MMSIRQQQNLLQYLGYYEGEVDGIWGIVSEAALDDFCMDNGNPIGAAEMEEVLIGAVFHGRFKNATSSNKESNKDWWGSIKYFRREEFACKCGKCGGYPVEPSEAFVRKLDAFRERVGEPVHINSGVRCAAHNAAVGGADDSRHLYGDAADIRCDGKTPEQLYAIADEIFCDGGVGLYDWGIHVDDRGHRARWVG